MSHTPTAARPGTVRVAMVAARWHSDIVDQAVTSFRASLTERGVGDIDEYHVPGAFEIPLHARRLARSGRYHAIATCAFVVDGGIYRHDFVASAVVDGLMRAGLDTGVPVLSVSLTPHHFQETEHHRGIFARHFVEKGREAARAALMIVQTRRKVTV